MEIKALNQMLIEAPGSKVRFVHIGNGGGTGGILTSQLLKVISGVTATALPGVTYVGADGDEFEPKNLQRQLCIPKDMGKNKAEVIVSRYANAYRLPAENVAYVSEFIKTKEQLLDLVFPGYLGEGSGIGGSGFETLDKAVDFLNTTVVLIDTVDKNVPRKLIHDFVSTTYDRMLKLVGSSVGLYEPGNSGKIPSTVNLYTVSCGNGEWTGQTVLGRKSYEVVLQKGSGYATKFRLLEMKKVAEFTDPVYSFSAVTAFEKYDTLIDVEEDKREEAMSCADRAVENVQSMNANNMAAAFALNYCSLILAAFDLTSQTSGKAIVGMPDATFKALSDKKLKCVTAIGEIKFNALTNSMRSIPFGEA